MKVISLKPAGTALNFRILAPVVQFLYKYAMTVAVISTVVTLIASAFDAHWLSIPAAFIALGAIYYETEIREGGES
ncbi:MAG: hypothetical protein K2K97_01270 [Muribaculaceae bacterium]|nr:hypothetical protein [Muribaculaceae bacterium]